MKINRNNYETFFLMYIDNELSAVEKNEVQLFLQQNSDLKKEFLLLQQTIAPTPEFIYKNKNHLIKDEIKLLQQNLLLLIDDELAENDKLKIQQQITNNIKLSKEYLHLQKTKFIPDYFITFKNKQLLFKHEQQKTSLIYLKMLKVAAAAIFIGLCIGVLFFTNNKKIENNKIVMHQNAIKNNTIDTINTNLNQIKEHEINISLTTKKAEQIINNNSKISTLNNKQKPTLKQLNIKENSKITYSPYDKMNNRNQDISKIEIEHGSNKINLATKVIIENDKLNNALLVANEEVNPNTLNLNNEQEPIAYIDVDKNENKLNKTKLGGLLKKITRIVVRNTKSNNGIKIANLDFANN